MSPKGVWGTHAYEDASGRHLVAYPVRQHRLCRTKRRGSGPAGNGSVAQEDVVLPVFVHPVGGEDLTVHDDIGARR